MLFEFALQPLEDITPSGKKSDLSLNWYYLTYGFYRMKVGDEYLFQSSEDILCHWRKNYPFSHPYPQHEAWMDYIIAHQWNYLLEFLPMILQPLPEELSRILSLDKIQLDKWRHYIIEHFSYEDGRSEAFGWMYGRGIDAGFLNHDSRPDINIWSCGDQVCCKWETPTGPDRIPSWTSMKGFYQMPRATFINEVHSFHNCFMAAMQERVEAVKKIDWKSKSIRVDLVALERDHADACKRLQKALNEEISTTAIDNAMAFLKQAGNNDGL